MPKGLKVSHLLIVNMTLFINICNFLKAYNYLYYDVLHKLHIGILEMIVFLF